MQHWLQQSTRTAIDLLFMNLLSCERLACTELVYAWPLCPPCRFSVCCCLVCLFCLSVWFLAGLARRHPFLSHLMFVSFICFHRIAWSRRVPDTERCLGAKKKRRSAWSRCKNSRFVVFLTHPDKPSAGVGVRRATCTEHFAQRDLSRASAQSTCAEQLAQSNLRAGHVPKKLLRAYVRACVRAVAFFCWFVCVCVCVCMCVCVCVCVCASCGSVRACKLCSFFWQTGVGARTGADGQHGPAGGTSSGSSQFPQPPRGSQGQSATARSTDYIQGLRVLLQRSAARKSDFGLPLRRERGTAASSPSRASNHSRAQCGCRSQGDRKNQRATGLRRLTRFCCRRQLELTRTVRTIQLIATANHTALLAERNASLSPCICSAWRSVSCSVDARPAVCALLFL